MRPKLLAIYLNDHLALTEVLMALARRCRAQNTEPPLADVLDRVVEGLGDDRRALLRLFDHFGLQRSHIKPMAARLAERMGRFKLNGRLTRYSDLSRLHELDALCAGLQVTQDRWRNLAGALGKARRIDVDLDRLRRQSAEQRARLDAYRSSAAQRAFLA